MSRFASLAAVRALNLALILTLPSFAQVAPGLPNFGAYSSHQADTIDLMNNNILVQFPGWQRDGAIPLSFTTFPNNFYMYVSTSNNTWVPPAAYLAISYAPAVDGFAFNPQNISSSNNVSCGGGIFTTEYLNWVVTTPNGTAHPLPSSFWVDSAKCFHSSATATTTDGSGLTLSIHIVGTSPTFVSLYDKAGNSLGCSGSALSGCATSPTTFTDRNGNTIVQDVNNSKITDSLGITALTWSGTGTSWTDVNGGSPSLTFSTSGTAGTKTNFGCTGINEYTSGSSGTTRTSTLTFADGRTASLTFEATPSNSGFMTGRPNVLTLPEGGTVTGKYLLQQCIWVHELAHATFFS